jgi:hypothetical protein
MNMRLIFLGLLSVIIAFYLKTQADGFDISNAALSETEQSQRVLHYVFSILMGLLGLCLFYLVWKPPQNIKQTILSQAATAVYLFFLIGFIAINYFLGGTLGIGSGH